MRELENFGPGEGANQGPCEHCFKHVTGCHVKAGADFLSGCFQTGHSQLCLSARIHGTDSIHMLSKFPRQTLIFRLPPPYLQESKELTATCHCHNNQCHMSCGDLLASSKSLVVEKMSQLLLLLPHPPTGGGMLYRPSGLRMLTRGRA